MGEKIASESQKLGKAIGMESDKRIDRRISNSMKDFSMKDLHENISEETRKFGKAIGMESEKRIDRRIKRALNEKHEQFQQQRQEGTDPVSTLMNALPPTSVSFHKGPVGVYMRVKK